MRNGSVFVLSSLRNLSWHVTALLGLAVLAIALQLSATGRQIDAPRAAARAAGMPDAVALAAFDPARDAHPAGEVNVTARIDPSAVITVTRRIRGDDGTDLSETRRLYPLQDAGDKRASTTVRGAVLLTDAQVGDFLALIAATGEPAQGQARIVPLNGLREADPPLADPALAALRSLGLEPADGFLFVMPFLKGRDAFLADHSGSWNAMVAVAFGLGGGLVVLAVGKVIRRQRAFTATRRAALPCE